MPRLIFVLTLAIGMLLATAGFAAAHDPDMGNGMPRGGPDTGRHVDGYMHDPGDVVDHPRDPDPPIGEHMDDPDHHYFPETGHHLSYGFKSFWEHHGGLPVFGVPLTEEFSEHGRTVQYFERQRFEYHPEHAGTPYEVELGRLGFEHARDHGLLGMAPFAPLSAQMGSDANTTFFPETGHRLSHGFREYWLTHGLDLGDPGVSTRESLALFGYPISEEFTDPASGLTVQYFERARFEYHPDNPEPYRILLGRLGADARPNV